MKAIGTKVIIKAKAAATVSEGGIALHLGNKNESHRGIVLSVGSQVKSDIKVNDVVVFDLGTRKAEPFKNDDGDQCAVLDELEIVAIIEE